MISLGNPWLEHVGRVRSEHPDLSYKEALKLAKTTYRKDGVGNNDTTENNSSEGAGDRGEIDRETGSSDDRDGLEGSEKEDKPGATPGEEVRDSSGPGDEKAQDSRAAADAEKKEDHQGPAAPGSSLSFQQDEVSVENAPSGASQVAPVDDDGPTITEEAPKAEQSSSTTTAPAAPGMMSGELLAPLWDMLTQTAGIILRNKYQDDELRDVWKLEDREKSNLGEVSAAVVNRYLPMDRYPELTVFAFSVAIIFGPKIAMTMGKINSKEKKSETKEIEQSAPIDEETTDSWEDRRLSR